jgi:hypothetical protein
VLCVLNIGQTHQQENAVGVTCSQQGASQYRTAVTKAIHLVMS